jgi:hypothetical protein
MIEPISSNLTSIEEEMSSHSNGTNLAKHRAAIASTDAIVNAIINIIMILMR